MISVVKSNVPIITAKIHIMNAIYRLDTLRTHPPMLMHMAVLFE